MNKMRLNLFVLTAFILFIAIGNVFAKTPQKIQFKYDAGGNRTGTRIFPVKLAIDHIETQTAREEFVVVVRCVDQDGKPQMLEEDINVVLEVQHGTANFRIAKDGFINCFSKYCSSDTVFSPYL